MAPGFDWRLTREQILYWLRKRRHGKRTENCVQTGEENEMSVDKLFFCLLWAWTASEFLLQLVKRTSARSGARKDRGSLMIILPVIFVSIWCATWYGDTRPHTMLGGAHWLIHSRWL